MTQLELTVLGIIQKKPCHAYHVEKEIVDRSIRDRMKIGFSTIYSTLKKLEKAGFLESHFKPQENLPGRRVYAMTFKGRQVFTEEIKKVLSQPRPEASLFETGLRFGDVLDRHEMKEALSLYDSELSRLIQTKVKELTSINNPSMLERAMLSRPLSLWQAERKWTRELLSLL
ncbi:MAG: PadR family transcriptional regulator [Fidelibacterota bacterium]